MRRAPDSDLDLEIKYVTYEEKLSAVTACLSTGLFSLHELRSCVVSRFGLAISEKMVSNIIARLCVSGEARCVGQKWTMLPDYDNEGVVARRF